MLAGAGHAHLYVVARARTLTDRGARVVLIDPGKFWYSGLATGMLGAAVEPAQDQIDPRRLIAACGGEFIQNRVLAVDAGQRRVHLSGGDDLAYDYLSLNVGSRVNIHAIAGMAGDASVWPVKPVANLWRLRVDLQQWFADGASARISVIGGGATGCEVAANIAALGHRRGANLRVTLISDGERLLKQAPAGAARVLECALRRSGVEVLFNTRIVARDGGDVIAADGRRIAADVVVPATGLQADPLIGNTGLPSRAGVGLRINAKLHSVADARVFAAGDCASLEGFDLPKLGVFGVRQAAVIHRNLLASLDGRPLTAYRPQKRYLSILNLGDGSALSTWGPLWWRGRSSYWLKNFIDRRFMTGYRALCEPA